MTKVKLYKYLGRNGILTTRILLDGINNIPMYQLTADKGMLLTNGEIKIKSVTIEEEDLPLWVEIFAD